MSEGDPSTEPLSSERKFFSKHKWRGKLFNNEEKISKSQEYPEPPVNDLVEFLQGPSRNRSSSAQSTGSESRSGGSPDSRLPSAAKNENLGTRDVGLQRRKAPRRKGLSVTFDSAPPEIIGEGGDEAELPSIDIAKSRTRAGSRRQSQDSAPTPHPRRSSPPPRIELSIGQEPTRVSQDEEIIGPPRLQRRSTGFDDVQQADASREASKAQGATSAPPVQRQHSTSSPSSEGNSEAFTAIYAEYTKASPLYPRVVLDQSLMEPGREHFTHEKDFDNLRDYSSLTSPEIDPCFGNSLTPIPSPQLFGIKDKPPSSYEFPATAPPKQPSLTPKNTHQIYQDSTESEKPTFSPSASDPTIISSPLASSSSLSPPVKAPQISLRTVAKSLGGDALNEFAARVQRFYGIFGLGASANKPLPEVPFGDWIRAGTWWFLKGRGELESAVRGRPGGRDRSPNHEQGEVPTGLKQAYLNLAKASWITANVTINHSELRKYGSGSMTSMLAIVKSFGDSNLADLIETHVALTTSLRALTMSMKRNDKMPPPDFEAQGLDSRVWVGTPRFTSGVASLLRGTSSRGLLEDGSAGPGTIFPYPVGDTKSHFNYGNMFVDVLLKTSDDPQQGVRMSCIVSLQRQRNGQDLEVVLASQDGKVHLIIQSSRRAGPTWRDVHWRTEAHCMILRLSDTLELEIKFPENSFRTLWGVYDYTRKIRKNMEAADGEETVFKSNVRCVHYVDTPDAKIFPIDPVQHCDVQLFEKFLTLAEGSGRRRRYNGHRLAVVTPPSSKTLSIISQHLGKQIPVLFSYVRGDDEGPAILLKNDTAGSTIVITFHDPAEREHFHSKLNGTFMREEELCSDIIPLQSMRICKAVNAETPMDDKNCVNSWRWDQLRVFSKRPENSDSGIVKTVLSGHLRMWVQCEAGAFVDRLNLGPGELQLSLSTDQPSQITLLRPPQQDMTVTFVSNKVSTSRAKGLSDSVKSMSLEPTLRTYLFKTLQELHLFQRSITGFSVLYDGFATNFAISRRRMVVPIYKKWEASVVRLQIVQLDRVLQLVGYFKDFPYGSCMNFVLKTTDNFESLTRSEQHYIRIIDAKFALPKKSTEANHEFVCLDMPEYPSEHDDITIGFESESERDRFGAALPAPFNRPMTIPLGDGKATMSSSMNGVQENKRTSQPSVLSQTHSISTLALHADDHLNRTPDVAPPIHLSTTFRYSSNPGELVPAVDQGHSVPTDAHIYSRETAPNTTRLEALLTPLLAAPCLTYSSGLAALHALYVFLRPDRVSSGAGYHGSRGVLGIHEKLYGMKVIPLDCPAEELQKGDVVHLETPVNPSGEARHIAAYAEKAHSRGAVLIVDATFGPPGLQEPFQCGADVVMHSGTKYLGGHSDMLMGVLATRREDWIVGLMQERVYLGSVMGSLEGWLGLRSLRTLGLRIKAQSDNAAKLVNWLNCCLSEKNEGQDEPEAVGAVVEKVQHASLQHLDMDWLEKQMPNGFGPVFALWMKNEMLARQLPSKLELFSHATSLGGVESLIEWRAMSDKDVDRRLIRVSVGLEGWEDLKSDFLGGFKKLVEQHEKLPI